MLNKHKSIIFFLRFPFSAKGCQHAKECRFCFCLLCPFSSWSHVLLNLKVTISKRKSHRFSAFLLGRPHHTVGSPKNSSIFFSASKDIWKKTQSNEPPGLQDSSWNSMDLFETDFLTASCSSVYSPPVRWTWKGRVSNKPAPDFNSTRQRLVWKKICSWWYASQAISWT